MKKTIVSIFISFALLFSLQIPRTAGETYGAEQSKEVLYQDIIMTLLGPEIDKQITNYYSQLLTENPTVYPYQIEVIKAERIGEGRTFYFLLVLDVTPVVGPHIQVGKDRLTFELAPGISPRQVKLTKFEHLQTNELPSHWKQIIRKSEQNGTINH